MTIRKMPSGSYQVDLHPDPANRIRLTFKSRSEAKHAERQLLLKYAKTNSFDSVKSDGRTLSELAESWFNLHGITLKDGVLRKSKLLFICEKLGNPRASKFRAQDFAEFRTQRIKEGLTYNTTNHDLAGLKSMYNKLIDLGDWKLGNPLEKVKPVKLDDFNATFLSFEQIDILLNSLKGDVLMISKICLSTGCRWSEAEKLTRIQVRDGRINFQFTKSAKSRTVPISSELYKEIFKGRTGNTGRLFKDSMHDMRVTFPRDKIELPKGQLTHVLRHTFAVHFMLDGGNILDLQKILGHKSLTMTLKYAQYHPDYLKDAVSRNPLARMSKKPKSVEA